MAFLFEHLERNAQATLSEGPQHQTKGGLNRAAGEKMPSRHSG